MVRRQNGALPRAPSRPCNTRKTQPPRQNLGELAAHQPAMLTACREALAKARRDDDFVRLDKAAFAALFRHFAPRVKAFLMKSGAGAALAEECAQDVMATLWQKSHLFDPSRASVAPSGSSPVAASASHTTPSTSRVPRGTRTRVPGGSARSLA